MKYSFVVPVYNIKDYLGECIESLLNQNCKNIDYEIILVDDGSTDTSSDICDYYKNRNYNIKVIHKKNGGLVSARKAGTLLAEGDYIIPVDGDDYVENGYLEYIDSIVDKYNPDVIALSYFECGCVGKRIVENSIHSGLYEDKKLEGLKNGIIYDETKFGLNNGTLIYSIWSKVIKRELYYEKQLTIPDYIKLGEDLLVNIRILNEAKKVYISDRPFYDYRILENSMIHEYNIDNIKHYNNLIKMIKSDGLVKDNIVSAFSAIITINQISVMIEKSTKFGDFYEKIKECLIKTDLWSEFEKSKFVHVNKKNLIEMWILKKKHFRILYFIIKIKKKI